MSRLAVMSDIHGNILALEAVVTDIHRRQVDTVINLGDHISGPLWPRETLEYLLRQDWIHIAGNHDRQLVCQNPHTQGPSDRYAYQFLDETALSWLKALPSTLEMPNHICLCHGAPSDDKTYLLETVEHGRVRLATRTEIQHRLGTERPALLLCGHTHLPRVVEIAENFLVVNPGSVGLPAYADNVPEPHIVETGSPHACYAILEQRLDHWCVEIIQVAYDHPQAARQAYAQKRPDWGIALQTGFMS